jgi:DNA-directed RNA polymerase specialized sigma24 family protein
VSLDEDLSELVRTRGDRLVRVAYQLTHDRAAAEDVVQEALFQVYRSWRGRAHRPTTWRRICGGRWSMSF